MKKEWLGPKPTGTGRGRGGLILTKKQPVAKGRKVHLGRGGRCEVQLADGWGKKKKQGPAGGGPQKGSRREKGSVGGKKFGKGKSEKKTQPMSKVALNRQRYGPRSED